MRVRFVAQLVPIVLLLCVASCAKVEIRKIGDDGEVVGPEGMRFYMPRPYVAVNEPFVLSGEAYLVGGEITPDGKYVLISDVELTDSPENRFVSRFLGGSTKTIPVTSVIVADHGIEAGSGEQAARESAPGEEQEGEEDQGEETEREEPEPKSPKDSVQEKSGTLGLKVANDNSAYAVTPMKRYFDIIWLPDFEEQYVVKGKAALGNASIAMQMGQGWSLQGIEASVNNSALVGRIFDLIDQGTEILSTLGRAQLGLPPVAMGGGEQSAAETPTDARKFSGGTPLTVKVTFLRIAAPGLYPILKPEEMERVPVDQDVFQDRILVPVAPMTNIAFNTYEAVVVEAAMATGDSALRLHQYIDLRPAGGGIGGGGGGGGNVHDDPDWTAVEEIVRSAAPNYTIDDVFSEVDAESPVIVKVRDKDGNSITSDADKADARSAVGPKVKAALERNARGYESRPIRYEFP